MIVAAVTSLAITGSAVVGVKRPCGVNVNDDEIAATILVAPMPVAKSRPLALPIKPDTNDDAPMDVHNRLLDRLVMPRLYCADDGSLKVTVRVQPVPAPDVEPCETG